jgi:hypothetical protein
MPGSDHPRRQPRSEVSERQYSHQFNSNRPGWAPQSTTGSARTAGPTLFQLGPDNALRLFADRTRSASMSSAAKESLYADQACEDFLLSMNINPDEHEGGPAEEDIAVYGCVFQERRLGGPERNRLQRRDVPLRLQPAS